MKNRSLMIAGAAAMGFAPFLAQAADNDSVQRCMDAFASQNFPNSSVSFVVQDSGRPILPLIAQTGTQQIQLVATSPVTGKVLGKTTCEVRETGHREGEVTVAPIGNE